METKRTQNSVIFLATLGVYIGLLMAGSSPGIIAQQSAAMTRNFELSEEFEVRDELDRDPEHAVPEFEPEALGDILSGAAVESLVRVYLSQYFVEPTTDSFSFQIPVPDAKPLTELKLHTTTFWPNDVRASAAFGVASLPRSSLNIAVACV